MSRTAEDVFRGGGAAGALLRAKDWNESPLGPLPAWPQSLLTSVSTCLDCAFPILIWWGPELVMIYNDEYAAILGAKHPAALGAPGRVVWPEIWDVIGPMLNQVVTRGEATRSRDLPLFMNRYGFEEETYFSFSYSPIRDESGGVGGVFTPVIETTEQVVGARRLRTLRELASRVSSTSVEAAGRSALEVLAGDPEDAPFSMIYEIDEGGRIRLLGRTGLAETWTAPDGAGPDLETFWPIREAIDRGSTVRVEGLRRRIAFGVSERPPPDLALVTPLAPAGGGAARLALVVGVNPLRPLDEGHESFLALLAGPISRALAEAERVEEERRRAESLAELDRAKTQFFSNVSHEFRTPLTLMLGPIEELLARPDGGGPEEASRLEVIHRNGLRLLKLVNTLLDASRIEAGRFEARFAPTDLSSLTADLAAGFRSLFERAGLHLTVDAPPLGERVYVDADLWEKIVLNLLSNAFKFTFEGGVRLALRRLDAENAVELSVSDTGVGVPEDEVEHLFERFHRVEGARGRSFEGSGIGLSLVRDLAALHGGRVAAESREGVGTTFTITLPLGSAHLPPDRLAPGTADLDRAYARSVVDEAQSWLSGEPSEDRAADPAFLPEPSPKAQPEALPRGDADPLLGRVLVADDNRDMRHYLGRLLESEGFSVTLCCDGEEAAAAAAASPPDIILSDVMMPKVDGLELVKRIRANSALAHTPVLFLTARAGESERIEGVSLGADDYLSKPFSARELIARVRTQIALSRARREALVAVETSERRMRLAQEAGRIGVWEYDPATRRFTISNSGALFGFAGSEDVDDYVEMIDPEDREAVRRAMRAALASGETFSAEYRIRRRDDGRIRWIASRAERQDGGGRPSGLIVGVSFDVTEQRSAELELRRLNATLASEVARRTADRDRIWRLSADLMLVAGFDGLIEAVNPAWTRMLGWREQDLIGRSFLDFVHPEDLEATRAEMDSLATGRVTFKFENRYRSADGSYRWLTWAATPDPDFIHAVGRDVTEEKAQAARLAAAEGLLRQNQKMEAVGRLTGGIAHDFNNLLGAVVGSFDLIRRHPDRPDRVARLAETGLSAAERGARLTGQLLTFSRSQAIELKPTEVPRLVEGMRELLSRTLGPMVRITIDGCEEDLTVLSDGTQLEMAILNLAINARDAMPDGGELHVRCEARSIVDDLELPNGEYVALRVADTGSGMTPEVAARAFDPFFTTKGVGRGTGLGLSQVYGLARSTGGAVRIDSAPGQGTRVELLLPRRPSVAEDARSPDAAPSPEPGPSRRILVVDDDDDMRQVICASLESLGYEVLEASNGREGVDKAEALGPELVLLDYAMPDLSGADVATAIWRRAPDLPIVFASGYADTAAVERAAGDRMVLLRKPFQISELQAALQEAFSRGVGGRSARAQSC